MGLTLMKSSALPGLMKKKNSGKNMATARGHLLLTVNLQYEAGDADLALVLHPDYWGLGKRIFEKITQQAFNQMGLQSITILLPPTRVKLQGIYQLGFALDGEVVINNQQFIRYRLCKPSCIEYGG